MPTGDTGKPRQRRQVPRVIDVETGKNQTLNQFKKQTHDRIVTAGISKSEIIKMKLLTKTDLEDLIVKYSLSVTKFGDKYYLDQLKFAQAFKSSGRLNK